MQPAENLLQCSILRMASSGKGGKSLTSGNLLSTTVFEPHKSRSAILQCCVKLIWVLNSWDVASHLWALAFWAPS